MNENYEKLTRDQFATYLDVTPSAETPSWKLLGFGITSGQINYNNQISKEKWIIHKNATSSHDSNQKQMELTQKCYKGEACYEYIKSLRDKVGAAVQGHVLDIDMADGTEADGVMKYPAKMSDCITPVSSFLGENAEIGYGIHYNGDPVEGTVTIADGVPTFTPTVE